MNGAAQCSLLSALARDLLDEPATVFDISDINNDASRMARL
jgi:hypothetical protein